MRPENGAAESGPLCVGGLSFDVVVKPERRSVRLVVERDAALVIETPGGVSRTALEAAVRKRLPWIYTKLAIRREQADARPAKEFVSGEGFYLLGRSYRLKIEDRHPRRVELVGDRLILRRDRVPTAADDLIAWYVEQGRALLPERAARWADRMGLSPGELRVRRLGYRWGSCSRDGRLNIHWATMQLPQSLLDYVLVHEVAHMRHHDHSPEFWRVVSRPIPDCVERRDELGRWGSRLWLPDRAASDTG
jgi:predicted metal-dependent hydrolase